MKGPAIVIEPHQTVVVERGWQAAITAKNHLVLTRVVRLKRTSAIGTKADPIMLEVFNNLFMSIAEQMGVALQNTAYSVNIKERLDFSCAVFAHDGTLVANAPHMPVHLGSMDRSVETVIRDNKGRISDVYVINAPYNGGTHLPDITVCTPVFDDKKKSILFWGGFPRPSRRCRRHLARLDVAERDHHRGRRRTVRQLQAGRSRPLPREGALRCATGAKYPARNPLQNVRHEGADRRRRERRRRAAQDGDALHAAGGEGRTKHVQDNAAESVRRVIDRLHDLSFADPWISAPRSG